MKNSKVLLVSINFETSKGGVSRVAHLMSEALPPSKMLSLYGKKELNSSNQFYFNKNRITFLWAVIKAIFFDRPKIIVFDHIGPSSILFFIPQFLLKKIIVFLHDEEAWKPVITRHYKALMKATHILCNSEYTYKKFIANNPVFKPKTKVCLLAGVPSKFEQIKLDLTANQYQNWQSEGAPYVLFVSRLWKEHRYKGHLNLIQAMKLAIANNPNFNLRLAIVGNGDDESTVREQIVSNQLENHIHLFTNVDDEALAHFYRNSLGLFFPSDREGFGFVFLEAMYFSKCCIGIADQPAEEIILDGLSGKLLIDNRSENILPVLMDMSIHSEVYYNMGLEGRKIFDTKFTSAHFYQRFLEAIQ
ncbi:MAG: glycosyltransferase [Cytophagales bacterium]|nr:MAG: glycosyltransferase [Cytophagales bacterium]